MRRHRPRAWETTHEPSALLPSWCAAGASQLGPSIWSRWSPPSSGKRSAGVIKTLHSNWIGQARPIADAETAATFDVWRAEILARHDRGDAALEVYQSLIGQDGAGAAMALDGAAHDDRQRTF